MKLEPAAINNIYKNRYQRLALEKWNCFKLYVRSW